MARLTDPKTVKIGGQRLDYRAFLGNLGPSIMIPLRFVF